jgi:DNA repair protein RadC
MARRKLLSATETAQELLRINGTSTIRLITTGQLPEKSIVDPRDPATLHKFMLTHWDPQKINLREEVKGYFFDRKGRLIAACTFAVGNEHQCVFPVRYMILVATFLHAKGLVVAHNHPAESFEPSKADKAMTGLLQDACRLFRITLWDHLIIGKTGFYSFVGNGLLPVRLETSVTHCAASSGGSYERAIPIVDLAYDRTMSDSRQSIIDSAVAADHFREHWKKHPSAAKESYRLLLLDHGGKPVQTLSLPVARRSPLTISINTIIMLALLTNATGIILGRQSRPHRLSPTIWHIRLTKTLADHVNKFGIRLNDSVRVAPDSHFSHEREGIL